MEGEQGGIRLPLPIPFLPLFITPVVPPCHPRKITRRSLAEGEETRPPVGQPSRRRNFPGRRRGTPQARDRPATGRSLRFWGLSRGRAAPHGAARARRGLCAQRPGVTAWRPAAAALHGRSTNVSGLYDHFRWSDPQSVELAVAADVVEPHARVEVARPVRALGHEERQLVRRRATRAAPATRASARSRGAGGPTASSRSRSARRRRASTGGSRRRSRRRPPRRRRAPRSPARSARRRRRPAGAPRPSGPTAPRSRTRRWRAAARADRPRPRDRPQRQTGAGPRCTISRSGRCRQPRRPNQSATDEHSDSSSNAILRWRRRRLPTARLRRRRRASPGRRDRPRPPPSALFWSWTSGSESAKTAMPYPSGNTSTRSARRSSSARRNASACSRSPVGGTSYAAALARRSSPEPRAS